MLAHYFCPYFKFTSLSFLLVIITFLLLILPQFFFPETGYSKFLQFRQIPHVYLTPIEIKHVSHTYLYEAITSMFFHTGWSHWLSNMFGIMLSVITMEYCWSLSIPFMLFGGAITNCYFVLGNDNVVMGFSGAISCCIGLYIGMFIGNWSHIQRYPSEMMKIWLINSVFVIFLLFSYSPKSTMIHLVGFGMGVLYGLAWISKQSPDDCEVTTGTVCKILSVVFTILPIVLIFMHPIGTYVAKVPTIIVLR